MFVAKIPNRGSPPTYLLRETYREGGKVKSRTLLNVTSWGMPRILALKRLLKGDFDHLGAGPVVPAVGPVFGVLYALRAIADRLGISRALGRSRRAKLALLLVLHRVAEGGSRLAACRWARDHAIPEILGLEDFDEDDLYDALDYLAERQEQIERRLYHDYVKRHGEPPTLVLYDVTSVWFEGEMNELAAYGYDRDGKRGKKIMVVGLVADRKGEPLAVRCFHGHRSDPTTVGEQIEIIKEQFGIQHVVFVGDGGMVKGKAVTAIGDAGFDYITSLGKAQIRARVKTGVIQLGLFDTKVCEVMDRDGRRLVIWRNPRTARKEQYRRNDKLERLTKLVQDRNDFVRGSKRAQPEAGLRKLQSWAVHHKLNRFVRLDLDGRMIRMHVDEDARNDVAKLDGCYVVTSNVSAKQMSASEVHEAYMALQRVERDFKDLKGEDLKLRPVFVRKAQRTRGHVFCAMLSLKILHEIGRCLRENRLNPQGELDQRFSTPKDVLRRLARVVLLEYEVPGSETAVRLPQMDDDLAALLRVLEVPVPSMPKRSNRRTPGTRRKRPSL